MRHRVLLLDDEPKIVDLLGRFLRKKELDVMSFSDPNEALAAVREYPFDAAVVDLKMPGMEGTEWAAKAREISPDLRIIIMTAFGTVQTAIGAMRAGVHDYLLKPFDMQDMYLAIGRALEVKDLERKATMLERELDRVTAHEVIGGSPIMRSVVETAKDVAQSQATVLITGESGVGKEVLARYIHHMSPRNKGPFVAVNCAAIPENLLEAELFGTRKGGYTDAVDNPGQFQMAEGGTLFLDEVGELPLSIQAKMLRAVEYLEIKPVGGQGTVKVDVRLLAATNRDLGVMVKEGAFRGDLYYRLNVFNLTLPPLRERMEDLEELAPYLIRRIAMRVGKPVKPVSPATMALFHAYQWPGNVRELENVLERALVLARTPELGPELFRHLQAAGVEEDAGGESFLDRVSAFERKQVEAALKESGGFKKRAAEILQISQRNLSYYLKKHGLGGSLKDQD